MTQGDNALGSFSLSVCPSVCALKFLECSGRYQSKVFVCVSNNHADAADWLFMISKLSLKILVTVNCIYFAKEGENALSVCLGSNG